MVGILVHGDNHFIVSRPLPGRKVALALIPIRLPPERSKPEPGMSGGRRDCRKRKPGTRRRATGEVRAFDLRRNYCGKPIRHMRFLKRGPVRIRSSRGSGRIHPFIECSAYAFSNHCNASPRSPRPS